MNLRPSHPLPQRVGCEYIESYLPSQREGRIFQCAVECSTVTETGSRTHKNIQSAVAVGAVVSKAAGHADISVQAFAAYVGVLPWDYEAAVVLLSFKINR